MCKDRQEDHGWLEVSLSKSRSKLLSQQSYAPTNTFSVSVSSTVITSFPLIENACGRHGHRIILGFSQACQELLSEIICKIFNLKGNAVLKSYYSMFLARGGKAVSSRSSVRESRKQKGLGKRKTKKPKKTDTPSG